MNELIFFSQLSFIIFFSFGALKIGKEALTALVALQALMANLFVLKQASFFGFHATCSDAFAIGSVLCLNLLRQYYGKESSQKALKICFYLLLFFALMAEVHLLYTPTSQDTTHAAYTALLSPSPRLLIASLAAFFLVQKLDLFLFHSLKKFNFTLRSHFSLIICGVFDTIFFSFFGLYGLVESLSDIMVLSFMIKLVIIFSLTPITLFSKRFVANEV